MIEQYSDEWFQARLGKVTASRIADVVARTKSGWGASRANYAAELIIERLTERPVEGYTNRAMQWGIETEPEACTAYEWDREVDCEVCGFVQHPTINMAGASPDRFVGQYGLVEFKCPNSATHLDTLLTRTFDRRYIKQAWWQMACTGRIWCDLVSYDSRFPERHRLFIKRVRRDDKEIKLLEKAVLEFLAELDDKIAAIERGSLKADLQASVAA
jgi:putative phage-type endonuclease